MPASSKHDRTLKIILQKVMTLNNRVPRMRLTHIFLDRNMAPTV